MTLNTLTQLHDDIAVRVKTISDNHMDWLCRLGCDGCCRRLADIPRLTTAEWEWLKIGLAALPQDQRQDIQLGIAALASQSSRPLTCPMLDQAKGACRVYAHRPVACRTYGFYVQRELGVYCKDIEARVAEGAWSEVVWGNHDTIDRRLGGLGETRDLTEWFAIWTENKGLD